jgi:hypothetical protein
LSNRARSFGVRSALTLLLALVALGGSISTGRAELVFQQHISDLCRPAAVRTIGITQWKAPGTCTNDCFVWRLTCTNGRVQVRQSAISPWTTGLQLVVANWAPWSLAVYILPFVVLFVMAAFGARSAWLLSTINFVVCSYLGWAAWCFYAAVVGDPWGRWVEFENAVLLNPYIYFPVVVFTVLMNGGAFLRGMEIFFSRHPADALVANALWAGHPIHAEHMRAALMPNIYEIANPGETTSYYRRETEKVRALKEKLDADAALAESVIRRERARRRLNDQT